MAIAATDISFRSLFLNVGSFALFGYIANTHNIFAIINIVPCWAPKLRIIFVVGLFVLELSLFLKKLKLFHLNSLTLSAS